MADGQVTPRPTANATSLAEFRAAKVAPAPAADPKPTPAASEPPGESAAVPETPTQETQDKQGKRDRSAEGRAAELAAQGRYEEARKILDAKDKKRDEEIAELRRKLDAPPQVAKPAAEPEATKPVSQPSDKPKLKDFLAKPENKDREYEDVMEDWEEACSTWRDGKRKAEAESQKLNTSFNEKMTAARQKFADFDTVTTGANFQATVAKLAPQAVAVAAHELPHGVEVLYQLASDPDECRRIAQFSQASQIIEMGVMSRALVAAAKAEATPPADPEKPKPAAPVSKTPPPARSLGGIAPATPKYDGPPESLAEHRARKAAAKK